MSLFSRPTGEATRLLAQAEEAVEAPAPPPVASPAPALEDDAENEQSKRRQRPKLTEEQLLDPSKGLALLAQRFRVRSTGKGREQRDLARLLRLYREWAFKLFPGRPFNWVVRQVERLGSKFAVKEELRRLRELARGEAGAEEHALELEHIHQDERERQAAEAAALVMQGAFDDEDEVADEVDMSLEGAAAQFDALFAQTTQVDEEAVADEAKRELDMGA